MAKRVLQVYSVTDKNKQIDYEIRQTKDVSTQIEWTSVLNSIDPLSIDLSNISNIYTCSVAATAPIHIEMNYTGGTYASLDGSMLIFSPAESVMASIESLDILSSVDDLEVKISVFGE